MIPAPLFRPISTSYDEDMNFKTFEYKLYKIVSFFITYKRSGRSFMFMRSRLLVSFFHCIRYQVTWTHCRLHQSTIATTTLPYRVIDDQHWNRQLELPTPRTTQRSVIPRLRKFSTNARPSISICWQSETLISIIAIHNIEFDELFDLPVGSFTNWLMDWEDLREEI